MNRRSSASCRSGLPPLAAAFGAASCASSSSLRKRSAKGWSRVHNGSSGGEAGPSPCTVASRLKWLHPYRMDWRAGRRAGGRSSGGVSAGGQQNGQLLQAGLGAAGPAKRCACTQQLAALAAGAAHQRLSAALLLRARPERGQVDARQRGLGRLRTRGSARRLSPRKNTSASAPRQQVQAPEPRPRAPTKRCIASKGACRPPGGRHRRGGACAARWPARMRARRRGTLSWRGGWTARAPTRQARPPAGAGGAAGRGRRRGGRTRQR